MKLKAVLAAVLLLAPTAALAAPGIVTVSTGLRAGPGPGFPLVDRIPGGSRVNVYGCLKGNAWCDVSWSNDRGWVSSQYLEYLYRNKYVYLPDYVDVVDVPVVPFVLSSYWSSYYPARPWYQRRAYWNNYWTSHQRVATQLTIDRSAARVGRAAAAQAHIAHEPPRAVRESNVARANARVQPASAHQAPRISAAPAARPAMPHVARPNVSHGSPMNAHAQMPAPRTAPSMAHGGGGVRQFNAAPAGGGGGHGRER